MGHKSMYLLIDIGNSTILEAVANTDGEIISSWRFDTIKDEPTHYFAKNISEGLQQLSINSKQIQQTAISSVVPEINGRFVDAIYSLTGSVPRFFTISDAESILSIDVECPEQVGKDRLADAIGALMGYGCPTIIIDFGTATTVGVITEDKRFLGGMIIPGVKTSHRALCERASQLSPINEWTAKDIIGRSTTEAMQSGMVYGTACMIDGIVERIMGRYPANYNIIATGGMAQYIVPYCNHAITIDKYLLLKGIFHAVISHKTSNNDDKR